MAGSVSAGARLIGRQRELVTLAAFLDRTVADGSTLLLTGDPGVGKTALINAAADMASVRGIRVIRGGGAEYETDVSFAGLHQLIDPLGARLSRVPQQCRDTLEVALGIGTGPAPDRLSVLNWALALFREASSRAPLSSRSTTCNGSIDQAAPPSGSSAGDCTAAGWDSSAPIAPAREVSSSVPG